MLRQVMNTSAACADSSERFSEAMWLLKARGRLAGAVPTQPDTRSTMAAMRYKLGSSAPCVSCSGAERPQRDGAVIARVSGDP